MLWLAVIGAMTFVSIHALNLQYLDPTKLQTVKPPSVQQQVALNIIKKYTQNITVEVDPLWFSDKKDSFQLKTEKGQLQIKASTGVAALWGFNYYLKKYCKSQIEWQTKNVRIPDYLPEADETVVANDRFRYYQNVCTVSYSFVWWNGSDWNKHIEWMALNGINLALAPIAQEAAWTRVYRKIGMTQEEIDKYFTGPAFLSWLRIGIVHGWGGPLSERWKTGQMELQDGVLDTMLSLGIVPVLPAFNGHVPVSFSRIYPNITFHNVDQWMNFGLEYCCGLFLDPFDPLFATIGEMFLNEITDESPPVSHIYTADPFNEAQISEFSFPFVQETANKIFATLSNFDKDAVWLLQNSMIVNNPFLWSVNRVKSFITSVPSGRMLIVDMQSEQWPQFEQYEMYFGQPFIWCMLHNFGGNLGMFGNIITINKDVYEVRSLVNSTMIGVGLTPEGINQNYVVYDLMLESAWRKSPVHDLDAWAADYAERRYGCKSAAGAWKYLLKSVYSFKGLNRVSGQYVVTHRPSFKIMPWAWYTSYDLFEAFRQLVFDTDDCDSEGYRYDLVDVSRQALQYRVEQLYLNVVNDRSSNTFVFDASINRFLEALSDMSHILAQNEHFSASNWFKMARDSAQNENEANLFEMSARNQITLWGPNGEMSDYACKQWEELMTKYYLPRWSMFLSAALKAKEAGEEFNEKDTQRVVTANVEIPFVVQVGQSDNYYYVEEPKAVAKKLYRKWIYAPDVKDLPLVISSSDYEMRSFLNDLVIDTESEELDTPDAVMYPSTTIY